METRLYSQSLGMLSTGQFQAALDRFQLGTFLYAEPILFGNFGQNVFLTSTQGAFVLRGAPFDAITIHQNQQEEEIFKCMYRYSTFSFNNEKVLY